MRKEILDRKNIRAKDLEYGDDNVSGIYDLDAWKIIEEKTYDEI